MSNARAGWYDDGSGTKRWWDGARWTDDVQAPPEAAGGPPGSSPAGAGPGGGPVLHAGGLSASYVVLQVILKEKLWGTGSGNLTELEKAINAQASRGYRLHTITTSASGSKGLGGGDRIQATMVFERLT